MTMNGVDDGAAAVVEAGWSPTEAAERFAAAGRADCDGDDAFGGADDDAGLSFQNGDARAAAAVVVVAVEQRQAALLCCPGRAAQAVELDFGSSSCSRSWTCCQIQVFSTTPGSIRGPSELQQHFRPLCHSFHLKGQGQFSFENDVDMIDWIEGI